MSRACLPVGIAPGVEDSTKRTPPPAAEVGQAAREAGLRRRFSAHKHSGTRRARMAPAGVMSRAQAITITPASAAARRATPNSGSMSPRAQPTRRRRVEPRTRSPRAGRRGRGGQLARSDGRLAGLRRRELRRALRPRASRTSPPRALIRSRSRTATGPRPLQSGADQSRSRGRACGGRSDGNTRFAYIVLRADPDILRPGRDHRVDKRARRRKGPVEQHFAAWCDDPGQAPRVGDMGRHDLAAAPAADRGEAVRPLDERRPQRRPAHHTEPWCTNRRPHRHETCLYHITALPPGSSAIALTRRTGVRNRTIRVRFRTFEHH